MASEQQRIELEIVGRDDRDTSVYFSDFRAFCAAVAECLKRSEAITTGRHGAIRYRVANLSTGSARMTLEAVKTDRMRGRDRRAQVVGFFKRTVTSIEAGKTVDRRLGIEDLQAFRRLAAPLKRHSSALKIDGTAITVAFEQNADRLLNDTVPTDGFVSGRLEKINVHERNEFVLFPPIPGYSIACRFEDALLERVREAIKKTVTVAGRMHYAPDSPFPRLVLVRTMEIHPPDSQLPTLSDLRGIGRGCTDGMTAVEFVRKLRDE